MRLDCGMMFAMTSTMVGCGATAGGVDIWKAVEGNDTDAIKIYSDAGGNLDLRNWDGCTPLLVAMTLNKKEAYKALLEHGADPDIIMSGNRCVTHLAALQADAFWLRVALESSADPNLMIVSDDQFRGGSPFRYAISSSHLESVKLLVEHGVDINKPDSVNRQPIAQAAAQNDFEIVLYLLKQGADYKNARRGSRAFTEILDQKWRDRDQFQRVELRRQIDAVHAWLEERQKDE